MNLSIWTDDDTIKATVKSIFEVFFAVASMGSGVISNYQDQRLSESPLIPFFFESIDPALTHTITHNLGTQTFSEITILVQNPNNLTEWTEDSVGFEPLDDNRVEITLARSSRIKLTLTRV